MPTSGGLFDRDSERSWFPTLAARMGHGCTQIPADLKIANSRSFDPLTPIALTCDWGPRHAGSQDYTAAKRFREEDDRTRRCICSRSLVCHSGRKERARGPRFLLMGHTPPHRARRGKGGVRDCLEGGSCGLGGAPGHGMAKLGERGSVGIRLCWGSGGFTSR